jgi:hypothetical protein
MATTLDSVWEWHGWTALEAIGSWVAGLGALLTVVTALLLGRRQLDAALHIEKDQRETANWAAAKSLYQRYLELCMTNPDYGDRNLTSIKNRGSMANMSGISRSWAMQRSKF